MNEKQIKKDGKWLNCLKCGIGIKDTRCEDVGICVECIDRHNRDSMKIGRSAQI